MSYPGNYVALTKCYFCNKDSDILLHRQLRDISKAHGKVVNMDPCRTCEGYMKAGVILITIDDAKSEKGWNHRPSGQKKWIPNPYRTGGFFVVTDEAVRKTIHPEAMADWAIKKRFMFIEHEAAESLGLFEMAKAQGGHDGN